MSHHRHGIAVRARHLPDVLDDYLRHLGLLDLPAA
jgi:hypothetical protein